MEVMHDKESQQKQLTCEMMSLIVSVCPVACDCGWIWVVPTGGKIPQRKEFSVPVLETLRKVLRVCVERTHRA